MSAKRIRIAPPESPGPAIHAQRILADVLRSRGLEIAEGQTIDRADVETVIIRLGFADLAKVNRVPLPDTPEAFAIAASGKGGAPAVTVCGRDPRGLQYGIFELIGQIERAPPNADVFEHVSPCARTPQHEVRSLCVFPHNRDIEEEWLFSRPHWERYFEMLARSRFNMFSLTFGHQTSYFAPPFPFMIDVPGYERVRTPDVSEAERVRNLGMLRMVSGLAADWGIAFVLGIWSQHANKFGEDLVEGLSYEDLFDYCPKALGILLDRCPGIRGLQFRMNTESGIDEDDQTRFYSGLLAAVRERGRQLWVDLRAKGLRQETIDAGRGLGCDAVVSTKFWTEHMGLPHFQCRVNPADDAQYRRYGYWDLLRKDRNYRMLYRLWSVGTQKLLLWGDLDYTRRFAESCHFGDGIGFEVCAPLSNKGYGNRRGGPWHVFADAKFEYTDWEFERYWAFYLAFGLAGYSPEAEQPLFDAEFHRRFGGDAAPHVRKAYEAAGGILPLITAAHASSASTFGFWPEMYTGGLSDAYPGVPPGDVCRFQAIYEYVEGLLTGTKTAKLSPIEVAGRLDAMAEGTTAALEAAARHVDASKHGEFAATHRDFEIQAGLARYHAARMQSGVYWTFFRKTVHEPSLGHAVRFATQALAQWERIVALTDGVYYDHMVFRRPQRQVAHWKDELPFLRHDVERLREVARLFAHYRTRPDEIPDDDVIHPWYEFERLWEERDGVVSHSPGECVPAEPHEYPLYGLPKGNVLQHPMAVVKEVIATRDRAQKAYDVTGCAAALDAAMNGPLPPKPRIAHADIAECRRGEDLAIRASVECGSPIDTVRLHYRRQVQSEDWTVVDMRQTPDGYEALIPGSTVTADWDMMYAIEAIDARGSGAFYPDMDTRPPYVVARVTQE